MPPGYGKELADAQKKEQGEAWDMSLITPRTRPAFKEKRSERLENVLKQIKKQDPLFERDVPVQYREEFDEEKMLTHLRETYTKPEFIIREPEEIVKYAASMDRIITICAVQEGQKVIRAYEESIVTKVSKDKKTATVKTTERDKKNVFETDISVDKLILYGRDYSTTDKIMNGEKKEYLRRDENFSSGATKEEAKKNVADGIRAKPHYMKNLSKRNLVLTTEDISFSEYYIPEGTEGFVIGTAWDGYDKGIKQPNWIYAFWIPQEGMRTIREFSRTFNSPVGLLKLNAPAEPHQVILIKKNTITFDKLYAELYHLGDETP